MAACFNQVLVCITVAVIALADDLHCRFFSKVSAKHSAGTSCCHPAMCGPQLRPNQAAPGQYDIYKTNLEPLSVSKERWHVTFC
jgi:hypothetical protein